MSLSKEVPEIEDEFSREAKDSTLEIIEYKLTAFIGSWLFLWLNMLFFILWVVFRLQYNLLTFLVSLEAIILAILILINENREIVSDRKRAIKDYKIDLTTARKLKNLEKEIKEIKEIVQRGGN
ncbi:hypothetical protein B5M47_03085 [candidate division CPR3 bacterium 4484_211]|uniref:DUF1003 domain-containing protein n=1 Tax=candidate division CPR3 bacterium 4484_211 TaxID=1968527 RepID=A0A1W9NXS4_UNCC3|nr:MAG: hypothetical protein B5M47_03085 [candidate division CPR3 bacterium 4484_211]